MAQGNVVVGESLHKWNNSWFRPRGLDEIELGRKGSSGNDNKKMYMETNTEIHTKSDWDRMPTWKRSFAIEHAIL